MSFKLCPSPGNRSSKTEALIRLWLPQNDLYDLVVYLRNCLDQERGRNSFNIENLIFTNYWKTLESQEVFTDAQKVLRVSILGNYMN